MLLGVAQVLAAQRFEVLVRIVEMLALVQVLRKLLEAAAHHFGQQMVTARIVLVRRLMRHTQSARHVAQAQTFDAVQGNGLTRCGNAGVAQFGRRGCVAFLGDLARSGDGLFSQRRTTRTRSGNAIHRAPASQGPGHGQPRVATRLAAGRAAIASLAS